MSTIFCVVDVSFVVLAQMVVVYTVFVCFEHCSGKEKMMKKQILYIHIFFRMHLASSKWSPKRRVAHIHVGEPSELRSL
jgi:hypothetical protein